MNKKPTEINQIRLSDPEGFINELEKESDRGAALIGAEFLNEMLKAYLLSFFTSSSTSEKLFGNNGILHSMAARAQIAYVLGLISKNEFQDFNCIIEIRNQFAHSLQGCSFQEEWIISKCEELITQNRRLIAPELTDARQKYTNNIVLLMVDIGVRTTSKSGQDIKRHPRSEVEPAFMVKFVNCPYCSHQMVANVLEPITCRNCQKAFTL